MKKILYSLPLIAVLSACVSTQSANTTDLAIANPAVNTKWTDSLVDQKAAMRSCIIANKDINAINYLEQTTNATIFTVTTKSGSVLECTVNPNTNAVVKIEPKATQLPSNLNTFYPVGKRTPEVCRGNERAHDDEGRLMGTVCY